jgi:hypothetical protein
MFVRFTGGGIGHLATRGATHEFEDEIQGLWGTVTTTADDSDASGEDDQSDNPPNIELEGHSLDPEEAFISKGLEMPLEEDEDWQTDEEQIREENIQADDGECVEDESSLGYELF